MSIQLPVGAGLATAFLVSLFVSGLFAWPIYALLLKIRSRQTVSEYLGESHQKKQGTPTMGGLIAAPGFVVACMFAGLDWKPWTLFLGFAAIGFLDDFVVPRVMPGKRGLGWIPKLALEVVVASVCLLPGLGVCGPFFVALFVILFFANAYNFADGLDGLAGGLLLIIAPALLLFCGILEPGNLTNAACCAALCGAVIPFLFLNSPPAKVFMGDVGSLPIGATLGMVLVSLYLFGPGSRSVIWPALALPVLSLVLIAELVPVPLQILSVKLRKGRRLFPRTPIHHTFEHWGWPESKITWMILLTQFVCAGLALSLAALGGPN